MHNSTVYNFCVVVVVLVHVRIHDYNVFSWGVVDGLLPADTGVGVLVAWVRCLDSDHYH